jgi:hypothetical protein
MSKRERTTALRSTATLNSTGTWPIPYGKGVISLSGRGGTGTASNQSGGNVASYGNAYNYVISYGNAYYVVDQPSNSYTAVDQPSTQYYIYHPGNTVNTYVYTEYYSSVQDPYSGDVTDGPSGTNYNHSCPSPTYVKFGYTSYYCEDYITSTTNSGTYEVAYNPTYYKTAYNPTYYKVAYNPDYIGTAYNDPTYNPTYWNTATTGTPMNVAGVTFPGGYGGTGTVITTNVSIPYSSSGLSVTIPSGGYVNITVST